MIDENNGDNNNNNGFVMNRYSLLSKVELVEQRLHIESSDNVYENIKKKKNI